MKITKILSVILALVMVIGCFGAISVSADTLAEGGTVYVKADGLDTNDGLTETTPVATLAKATEIIAAANVQAATVKFIGTFTTPTSTNFTEAAHPNTVITYTGNDADAIFKLGKQFVMNGPVIFKDLQINPNSGKRIYHQGYKLVMDTGLTMTTAKNLRIEAGYGNAPTINGVDITINSGTYARVTATDIEGCVVNGDVNITIDGAGTQITQLYIGGSDTAKSGASKTITGETNVTINNGIITQFFIGNTKSGESAVFGDRVYIKINGGASEGGGNFGGNANAASTTFSDKGCVVDFSGYVDQGDVEDGANFACAAKWKSLLNALVADANFINAFHVTDCTVAGMQQNSDKTAARFIIGIRDYASTVATVTVVAKDAEGGVVKTFENVALTQVYTSVNANANGVNTTVTAAEMGANYIMALTITGVPTSGVATFEVTPTINGTAAPTSTFAN